MRTYLCKGKVNSQHISKYFSRWMLSTCYQRYSQIFLNTWIQQHHENSMTMMKMMKLILFVCFIRTWNVRRYAFTYFKSSEAAIQRCSHSCRSMPNTHAKQLYWNHTLARMFCCKLASYASGSLYGCLANLFNRHISFWFSNCDQNIIEIRW